MAEQRKEKNEACKKEACQIQACLTKNNFLPQKCLRVIELLESCCEKCDYNSTHCASLSGLLGKNNHRPKPK
ncbi:PREDICTED: cx9C motif-containing protein 4 [Lupinus angustifolius]|uniref:cx9C motif-containing protein 4 n=1 Tax=Lupinus angustifolius TaxID=3871 RepID=UPI00092EC172|nr:PREDICTED: cx9C motif-containing protein 4 [Lupinus angustifolius]